ncbi:MAG: desulfoferrodoxin family protein [Bacilli bacterium]|nr:desulfoferrodoxin family protein [Bacilli bacterium]
MQNKFFICEHCGNIIGMIYASGVPVVCCGEEMKELVPNTVDAAQEKHVPVVEVKGNTVEVKVGSVAHPMIAAHFIQWIYLETKNGGQRKALVPGEEPKAVFTLINDEPIAAYAYCNLHGLWKTEIKK